jgi:cytochrome c
MDFHMRKTISLKPLIVGLITLLLGVTLLAAQPQPTPTATAEATPEPVTLTCDLAELQQKQSDLAASLQTFSAAVGDNAGAALDNLFKVGAAYQQLALDCGYIPADAASRTVGTDVERILNTLSKVMGDPLNGQILYNGNFACASCHETGGGVVAPHTEGTYTRIEETRLKDPKLAGYTAEQYIVESIVQPTQYVVPNYQPVMPTDFGTRLTLQDMADLIAFLESQDGPSPE